ncbi:MAG: hypothetical protein GY748_03555 [Planctomycetaceae bacterium]|nr:hypothetical protein [Planctomycetaceae bacterium]
MSSDTQTQPLPRSGGGSPVTLVPGIYVAARRLNVSGIGSFGAHQFVIGIPERVCMANTRSLAGHEVIVLGAYNQSGRLQPSLNASSDVTSLRSYLTGAGSLHVARVSVTKTNSMILSLVNGYRHYVRHENTHPIAYPTAYGGASLTGCDTSTTYNSNSWAQSLIVHRIGPGRVIRDFSGIDICNGNTIPAAYFK